MPEFSRTVIGLASSMMQRRAAVAEQGGLLSGQDPTKFNDQDPLRLWIIQVGVIITTAQLLSLVLRKLRQPKVIAEVLGGILLGPTAFGRIPGFTEHIFPKESIPYLSLVANIGLVLFLFIVGLEIEASVIKRNARFAVPIALGGMVLPFGMGAALAVPLYNTFIDSSTKFTHFMLFTGVAYSITAFPVLCRILTELKLVDTTVGIVVLSAGVGNDIIGWTLLALSVALVNAASGLMSLWILLTAIGWTLFLLFPVKRLFLWLAHRTGSIENGPSMFFMTVTILMTFGSAFFTDVIGVHAIFGGFVAGLVVPREGGLAITLTEKLEDMVSIIFLPLYFTLSGLSTNLGLLNTGITWGYTIAIMALAYLGKFGGCAAAAKLIGFSWRESSAIGTLMSCKGLVELIVLNVGLNAGILTPRVFSMFVLEALVLTFMTTPVVSYIYPPEVRVRASAAGDHAAIREQSAGDTESKGKVRDKRMSDVSADDVWKSRFTVVLDKLEHVPGMMSMTQLIHPPPYVETDTANVPLSRTDSANSSKLAKSSVVIDALRLIELSDRTSAVMKSSHAVELIRTDPLLAVFKTFGDLNDLPISTSLSVVTFDDLASRVADHARENFSQLVLVPWLPPSVALSNSSVDSPTSAPPITPFLNPFDALFRSTAVDTTSSSVHAQFIRGVFSQCSTDVALYVDRFDRTRLSGSGGRQHIFLPFLGGPDDRLALEFVIQLCANRKITATVIRITKSEWTKEDASLARPATAHLPGDSTQDQDTVSAAANLRANGMTVTSLTGHPDTVYGHFSTQTRLQSDTADNIVWERFSRPSPSDPQPACVEDALTRMTFAEISTPTPLYTIIEQAKAQIDDVAQRDKNVIAILGRSRRLAVENHRQELKEIVEAHGGVGSEVKKTIGDVATALVVSSCNLGLVVMQAANHVSD